MKYLNFSSICTVTTVGGGGEGGCAARIFLFSFFPCSADYERDRPPCKKKTNLVGNRYTECEKRGNRLNATKSFFSIFAAYDPTSKRFDIFPPDYWGMMRRSRRVQIFLLKNYYLIY